MSNIKEIETFRPKSQQEWRNWLKKNHKKKEAVWLMMYRKETGEPTISWSEAVDEALCFGWIDSKSKAIDKEKFIQFFSRRKLNSTWSKINKAKIGQLIEEGRMTQAGLDVIEIAKKNGSWNILNDVDAMIVPEDLMKAFRRHPGSKKYFMSLSNSMKKMLLQHLVLAKRPETRQRRIDEIAELAAKGEVPKQFKR